MKIFISNRKINKSTKNSMMLMSLIYIIIGLVLLIKPVTTSKLISFIFAGLILVYGIIKVYTYLKTNHDYRNFFDKLDLIAGIISVALGLFLFFKTEIVLSILPFLVGIYLVFNSICGIQASLHLKHIQSKSWIGGFILSIVLTVLGIVLVFNPFSAYVLLLRFIGVSLIVNAISDIWVVILSTNMRD